MGYGYGRLSRANTHVKDSFIFIDGEAKATACRYMEASNLWPPQRYCFEVLPLTVEKYGSLVIGVVLEKDVYSEFF